MDGWKSSRKTTRTSFTICNNLGSSIIMRHSIMVPLLGHNDLTRNQISQTLPAPALSHQNFWPNISIAFTSPLQEHNLGPSVMTQACKFVKSALRLMAWNYVIFLLWGGGRGGVTLWEVNRNMGTRVVTGVPMLSNQFHYMKSCVVADSIIFLTHIVWHNLLTMTNTLV
jgi:hypothetical protein